MNFFIENYNHLLTMPNQVTERFIACHDRLKEEKKIVSSRQFALTINTAPQSLNQVLKGKRDVTVVNVMSLVEHFNVNSEYLLAGIGPMFREGKEIQAAPARVNKIMYVPIEAHAGYCDQFHETITEDDLDYFSLPGYQPSYGEHRCFDVTGDSMEPTLFSGDKIICSLVSPDNYYSAIRENYVYVVITNGDIRVKRVINKIKKEGVLYLNSDNGTPYKTTSVEANEIKEIWLVNLKISPFMPNPSNVRNGFHEEIDSLRSTIKTQSENMSKMNRSLESLLKRSR